MMIKYEKLHFCTPVTLMGGGGYSLAHVQLYAKLYSRYILAWDMFVTPA